MHTSSPLNTRLAAASAPHGLARLFSPAHPFWAQARQGKFVPNLLIALPVLVALLILSALPAQFIMPWLDRYLAGPAASALPLASAVRQVIHFATLYLPLFGLLALWLRLVERRPFASLGFLATGVLGRLGHGLLVGVLINSAPVAIAAALGYVTVEVGSPAQQGLAALGGVLVVLLGWLIQGAAEEVATRGWLMQVVGVRYRPWVGVLVASLIFAVLHALNPGFSPIAAVNLALFGLLAALYVLIEGDLWGVCALHAAANWTQGNLLGMAVSGRATAGGALLNLDLIGPLWLSGGSFGVEGSLLMTGVLMVGIGVLIWRARRTA